MIVGGVAPPPGDTTGVQCRIIEKGGRLRRFVLNEPRGGVFRYVEVEEYHADKAKLDAAERPR